MLRLYGTPQGRLAAAVALFAPQWRAEAQWKSRGAETLLAVHADTPTGLKKAAQSLRSSFGADDTCQKYVSQVVEVIKNKGYTV